jgi:dTDP-4-dehydrorhamnose reductase
MRFLITGAAGMLGRDLIQMATQAGHEVVALPRGELDITDADAVGEAVRGADPQVVFNCAAYTNVDGAEAEPGLAAAVNAQGAGNVAEAAAAAGAWTVHVSSDYVFDGSKRDPYVESDAPSPISEYGRSKLAGEREVAARAPGQYTIVRSSWLFGTGGPCFPATILRLARERGELTVVDDQVGCPTFTGHLADALVRIGAEASSGVVHVAAAGQCSWFEFASAIVTAAELGCEVRPVGTDAFPRPAPRPAYSVLRSERPEAPVLPSWEDGLSRYMSEAVAIR